MITIKKIKLNKKEDSAYGKSMAYYLNNGLNEKIAEIKTIEELKRDFPRLKKLLTDKI